MESILITEHLHYRLHNRLYDDGVVLGLIKNQVQEHLTIKQNSRIKGRLYIGFSITNTQNTTDSNSSCTSLSAYTSTTWMHTQVTDHAISLHPLHFFQRKKRVFVYTLNTCFVCRTWIILFISKTSLNIVPIKEKLKKLENLIYKEFIYRTIWFWVIKRYSF